jgi:excinuclease ABC subunit A
VDKVIDINQSPIGRTPRSNPATYTGVFDMIRDLFSQTTEAKVRGYKPGRFSFNVKGGRCEACKGDGIIKIEMHFLPDVYVPCEVCKGRRYNRETLDVKYKGKTIADVLDMTVGEACVFFENIPPIQRKMTTLRDVGLDYIRLGQPATTLSGGEAQRVKLASELSKRGTGQTLYILDEPTTGLHFADIAKLLEVLGRLVDQGNTVVVIEHNLDVIKTADWVIDMGPDGGDQGGRVVAEGTPEQVAEVPESHTGQYLNRVLHGAKAPFEK